MTTRRKLFLRGLVFIVVLALAVNGVAWVFGVNLSRNFKNWKGLRKEKKGSMDAVFIGASNVIAFWQPAFGWQDHGIAVFSLSMQGLTCAAIKHMIIEARKTQPDALYIINLSTFKQNRLTLETKQLHYALDYMPFSLNKLSMTGELIRRSEFRGLDTLEYYLPIIRFHSRWEELQSWVFSDDSLIYKASDTTMTFCENSVDISDKLLLYNDARKSIPDDIESVFLDLLDYLDSQHVNALFVKSPQAIGERQQGRMNKMEDILEQRGYPCLDMLEDIYKAGIDPRTDFYNVGHTNIHGSIKFTKAMGDYLVERYHFEDKRGQPGWESWDRLGKKYAKYCAKYALPFELEHAFRYTCDIPALSKPAVEEQSVRVAWTDVGGADGYAVFRKSAKADTKEGNWTFVAETDAAASAYMDNDLDASTEYVYTVVPIRMADGIREYGSFDVKGVHAVTGGKSA